MQSLHHFTPFLRTTFFSSSKKNLKRSFTAYFLNSVRFFISAPALFQKQNYPNNGFTTAHAAFSPHIGAFTSKLSGASKTQNKRERFRFHRLFGTQVLR
jgi:hypothetical protein